MSGALKVRVIALAVALVAAVGLLVTLTTNDSRRLWLPVFSTPLTDSVSAESAMTHLEALQDIADAHGGRRLAGTDGYEASAQYVEQVLNEAGYVTQRQTFTYEVDRAWESTLTQVSPDEQLIGQAPMHSAPATPEGGVEGEIVVPGDAAGCGADSYSPDAAGKIALAVRGSCSFAQKSAVAAEVGAVALVIYNNEPGPLYGSLDEGSSGYVPTTGISQAEGSELLAEVGAGPVTLRFDVQYGVEQRESFNVIAETTDGDPSDVLMIGAHLDGAPEGAGINDNGSGVAAALEIAVRLADQSSPSSTVRFAFWGAEEAGLYGSTHYVTDLAESDPTGLSAISLYLNLDMLASPNYMIGVYEGDSSNVITDYFYAQDQPWVDVDITGSSDHAAFEEHGVPVTGLYTGSMEIKDAEDVGLFGGTADAPYDPGYHTSDDDLDNVNAEALQINLDAIAYVVQVLAGVGPADTD